ncbi:transcriptional regulator [Paraburkholderia sp. RL18-101-BIB-B]|uniref:helix-turn-helix domain-containing protein n=1 Tax=Paraburkholderia sp. RL18-101-BIB-B TaxID=3031634 RepID=UPI0038BBB614
MTKRKAHPEAKPAARPATHKVARKKTEIGLVFDFEDHGARSVHRLASAIRKLNGIDAKTMREYDELCLAEVPHFDAAAVARIRKGVNVSQALFARYLNTSLSSVQKRENGKAPSGIAARMLQLVEKHGVKIFE